MISANKLAAGIARMLFELGGGPDDKCQRLEFKGGQWPDNETDISGVSEESLAKFIEAAIDQLTHDEVTQ